MLLNISLLIADQGVPMRKCTSLYVLPRNTNSISLIEKSCPRKALHACPIKRLFLTKIFNSFFVYFTNGRVDVKIGRPRRNFVEQFGKNIFRNTSRRPPKSRDFNFIDFQLFLSKCIVGIGYNLFVVLFILFCKLIFKFC